MQINILIHDTDVTLLVDVLFDHCGNLHFVVDNRQYMVNFDRDNNLILELRSVNLTTKTECEYSKLLPHLKSLRKKAGELDQETNDSDDEADENYFPEDDDYTTDFDPYNDENNGFFGTELVDLTNEEVQFTAATEDAKYPVMTDPDNNYISLYETIIYNKGYVQFKSCLINSVPMFRLVWYTDKNLFEFRPTGSKPKSFRLEFDGDNLIFISV